MDVYKQPMGLHVPSSPCPVIPSLFFFFKGGFNLLLHRNMLATACAGTINQCRPPL